MHLADFIEANIEPIMNDWAGFARRPGVMDHSYTEADLRDSAREILAGIVADMRAPLEAGDQSAKSKGERPLQAPGIRDQARSHAENRRLKGYALDELVRFNESVDQALTESVRRYSDGLTRTRDLFEGILAHDLRSPLQAMVMSAGYLLEVADLPDRCVKAVARIQASCARMQLPIHHLLDFTRTRLGDALPAEPRPASMKVICERAIDEISAFNPERTIRTTFRGNLNGLRDVERLSQVATNLLGNAIQHGDSHSTILVEVGSEGDGVTAAVFNHGPTIPADALSNIFDPLCRAGQDGASHRTGEGLGLGLYIVRQIVESHGGSVHAGSRRDGTTFTIRVPRRARRLGDGANA
ncbi:sensor histidine kinase [Paraburkholderia aspalathi]|uniref:histidine kinase n=1 Tax=Paraburkholderia aspalathi TaxID=1324617 RepID=A0A1I7EJ66_9BURK|nr:sensor histidine kinase [Paraburkholderia aspalathi]SFU23978.1 Signal transduction histidine kinase [Paraburkholderia aspalathi]